MNLLLNLIWFVFGGVILAIVYFLLGLLACITIIGIPIGVAMFRMASYALWPFGRTVVAKSNAGAGSVIGNIIWAIVAGIPIVVSHLGTAAFQAITIIGIPLAIANVRMIPISLVPFGKMIVPSNRVPPGYTPLHAVASEPERLGGSAQSRVQRDLHYRNDSQRY